MDMVRVPNNIEDAYKHFERVYQSDYDE